MNTLNVSFYDSPNNLRMFSEIFPEIIGLNFTTNEHGFASCSFFIPMDLWRSFTFYDRPGLPYILISSNGMTVWEGRLEDVGIVNGGVRLGAFGYQRAMGDTPYTALWSMMSVADWLMTPETIANANPNLYQTDNNNRLFLGLNKNAVYLNNADIGSWTFLIPNRSARQVQHVAFDYSYVLPTNWTVRVRVSDEDYTNGVSYNITTTGGTASGSFAQDISANPRERISIQILNSSGSNYTYAGETGANFLRVTNLRLKSTTSSSVYANEIAQALVAYINGINSSQLQNVTALIELPALDLRDEIYEDALPSDILTKLAFLGDNQAPPRQWEWGVWENRILHFRPRGSSGRAWYVDVSALEVERTIEALRNSAYAKYQDADNRVLRTAVSADADSVARYGLTRRGFVDVDTTSATQAGTHRDAFLQDRKDPIPRSAITFDAIYDASGARWPLYAPRSGDTLTIRNLPPTLGAGIDRVRTFRLARTEYDADSDVLHVEPESPLPRLEVLVARREEGIK